MEIIEFEPEDKQNQKHFLQLPYHLYKDDPNWVPPIKFETKKIFRRSKHGFYQHGEVGFLLAMHNGNPVGRLTMLHNKENLHHKLEDTAYFFLFEAFEDPEITH